MLRGQHSFNMPCCSRDRRSRPSLTTAIAPTPSTLHAAHRPPSWIQAAPTIPDSGLPSPPPRRPIRVPCTWFTVLHDGLRQRRPSRRRVFDPWHLIPPTFNFHPALPSCRVDHHSPTPLLSTALTLRRRQPPVRWVQARPLLRMHLHGAPSRTRIEAD